MSCRSGSISSKLAVTAVVSETDFASVLDRRLQKIAEMDRANGIGMKVISPPVASINNGVTDDEGNRATEVSPANGGNGGQPEVKRPLPRIAFDKRFRRM